MNTIPLIDPDQYLDPDVAAARAFARELADDDNLELLPGVPGESNFCSLAVTLAAARPDISDADLPAELASSDPAGFMQTRGGGGEFFDVSADRVVWPYGRDGEHSVDMVCGYDTADIAALERRGFRWDDSGGEMMRLNTPVPGPVKRFVARFDAGEFPSLTVPDCAVAA